MGIIRNWKRLTGLILVVGIVLTVGKIMMLCSAPEQQPGSLKIGIVNINEVFTKFKKRDALIDQLKKSQDEENANVKKIEDKIKNLQKQLEEFKTPEGDLWNAIAGEIDVLRLQREQSIKLITKRLTKKQNDYMAQLYNDIRNVVNKYAKEKGFTIVLKTEPQYIQLEEDQQENATMGMYTRSVLYHDKTMDITPDIIKILNGE